MGLLSGPLRFAFPLLFFLTLAAVVGMFLRDREDAGGLQTSLNESRNTALVRAVDRVAPSVVSVSTIRTVRQFASSFEDLFMREFFGSMGPLQNEQSVPGLGSGIVLNPEGIILTNDHVVAEVDSIWVKDSEGRQFVAELLGTDPLHDLAVIRVDDPSASFQTAPLGDSDDLKVGEWVVALGSPYGAVVRGPRPTVTAGVVSAVDRDIRINETSAIYKGMIQTDATIHPGNSGGPLVNAAGQIIGINTFSLAQSGVSLGIGFAIPINTAMRMAQELIRYGEIRAAWVGIAVHALGDLPGYVLNRLGATHVQGLVVWTMEKDSPSEDAGIQLGDIIREVNGEAVMTNEDAKRAIFGARIGDTIVFTIERKRDHRVETIEIPVTLRPMPNERRGVNEEMP